MIKILLVEDDPLMVRMYQRKLTNDGYEVAVGVNGEEGLVRVRSFRPDLVLLDIMMPKLNGLQVLERMKADPTISSIPVIILTNLGGSQEDVERGLELGAVAYLVKSAYRPDEVVMKVKEVLKGYTRSKEIPEAVALHGAEQVLEETTVVSPPPVKQEPQKEEKGKKEEKKQNEKEQEEANVRMKAAEEKKKQKEEEKAVQEQEQRAQREREKRQNEEQEALMKEAEQKERERKQKAQGGREAFEDKTRA